MRVAGDPQGCEAAARALYRVAGEVERSVAVLSLARSALTTWTGTAAERWVDSGVSLAASGLRTADRAALAGRALQEHGLALAELQTRAARLVAEAALHELVVEDDGWLPPVPLPAQVTVEDLGFGPTGVQQRTQARARLVSACLALKLEEQLLHDRLARALRSLDGVSSGVPGRGPQVSWVPTGWDAVATAPAVAGAAARLASPLGRGRHAAPPRGVSAVAAGTGRVLRHVPGMTFISFGTGVLIDTRTGEMSTRDAVAKGAVGTIAGWAAGAAVGTGGVIVLGGPAAVVGAPAVAIGIAAVTLGTAVGYGTSKAWEAWGPKSPPPARPVPVRAGPPPRPTAVPARPPAPAPVVVACPSPAPAPAGAGRPPRAVAPTPAPTPAPAPGPAPAPAPSRTVPSASASPSGVR